MAGRHASLPSAQITSTFRSIAVGVTAVVVAAAAWAWNRPWLSTAPWGALGTEGRVHGANRRWFASSLWDLAWAPPATAWLRTTHSTVVSRFAPNFPPVFSIYYVPLGLIIYDR